MKSLSKLARSARDVLAERRRQVEGEEWSAEHDDAHTDGSLARAAACYAFPGLNLFEAWSYRDRISVRDAWPARWSDYWDKRQKHDRRRRLVIAGALILAEIDRLDRQAAKLKKR